MPTTKLIAAFFCGGLLGIALSAWTYSGATNGSLSSCRAANPGYDCGLGWVKTEAFK